MELEEKEAMAATGWGEGGCRERARGRGTPERRRGTGEMEGEGEGAVGAGEEGCRTGRLNNGQPFFKVSFFLYITSYIYIGVEVYIVHQSLNVVVVGTNSGCLVLTTEPANMGGHVDFTTIAALIRCNDIRK